MIINFDEIKNKNFFTVFDNSQSIVKSKEIDKEKEYTTPKFSSLIEPSLKPIRQSITRNQFIPAKTNFQARIKNNLNVLTEK